MQLNSILYAKTLKRKDIASSTSPNNSTLGGGQTNNGATEGSKDGARSSKAQVMTLMTTDVDRVGELPLRLFSFVGASNFFYFDDCSDSKCCQIRLLKSLSEPYFCTNYWVTIIGCFFLELVKI